ncbi:hypothetical protein HYW75_00145 [Candidatus Pacearchaeota archaeon]|nr:hypothetical protein [Candidatus Pacearchaeota archaeon]
MAEESTILLNKKVIEKIKEAKEYPKQTYNEILEKMARLFTDIKKQRKKQYDQFLHEIQKSKMKELWDNEYDELISENMKMSESAFAESWNSKEDEVAFAYLQ